MATDQTDKLKNSLPTGGDEEARPPRRPRAAVWPADTGESEDTFATPSQASSGEVDHESLAGPEPAVFGGVNPNTDAAETGEEGEATTDPLGTALDQSVTGNELLADAPRVDLRRIIRTTPFLLGLMVLLLIAATFTVRMIVDTEAYVQMTVRFNNYDQLNEVELQDLQLEMAKLLRTYPLRAGAWDILQKKSPGVLPGFLNSGLTFHRLDAITWSPEGELRLRLESEDPATDITRLSAVTDAFYAEMKIHAKRRDEYLDVKKVQEQRRGELNTADATLKQRIDDLLPDAQRYMDLKLAMQSVERYLELADESNPLRMIARQNLTRLTRQVSEAREMSLERDELLSSRVNTQKEAAAVDVEIARLQRAIDIFAYPSPPDPSQLKIHDTRGHRQFVTRTAWGVIIAIFASTIVLLQLADRRATERLRRERRELLKAKAREKA